MDRFVNCFILLAWPFFSRTFNTTKCNVRFGCRNINSFLIFFMIPFCVLVFCYSKKLFMPANAVIAFWAHFSTTLTSNSQFICLRSHIMYVWFEYVRKSQFWHFMDFPHFQKKTQKISGSTKLINLFNGY